MKQPRITCPECEEQIPLYAQHKKCDPRKKKFKKTFIVAQNRWHWFCLTCIWNGRSYACHDCLGSKKIQNKDSSHFQDKKAKSTNPRSNLDDEKIFEESSPNQNDQIEEQNQNEEFKQSSKEHYVLRLRDYQPKEDQEEKKEQKENQVSICQFIQVQVQNDENEKVQRKEDQHQQKNQNLNKEDKEAILIEKECRNCTWKGFNYLGHKCLYDKTKIIKKNETSMIQAQKLLKLKRRPREVCQYEFNLPSSKFNRNSLNDKNISNQNNQVFNQDKRDMEINRGEQPKSFRPWELFQQIDMEQFARQTDAMFKEWKEQLQKIQRDQMIGEPYLEASKIALNQNQKAHTEANLEKKLEMYTLVSLLRFVTYCRFNEQEVLVDWNSKITHFSKSKFFERLYKRFFWMKKYELILNRILQGFVTMVNKDIAKISNTASLVLRLRDLIEWNVWQPDYVQNTSQYLSQPWKRIGVRNLIKKTISRRKRKDPNTLELRQKLSRRKYRLSLRQKTVRNDFKKKGLRVLTAANYDYLTKKIRDIDIKFAREQILKTKPPKGHQSRYGYLRNQVIEAQAIERVIDYLVVSQLLSMYIRAKPPKNDPDEKKIYQYNNNNVHAKLVANQLFKPQMKQLTEVVPISPSTLKRELSKIHQIYEQYTIKKHLEFQNRFSNEIDFETHLKNRLIQRGLLAQRDQFNDMERDDLLSKLGQVKRIKSMNQPDPNILEAYLIAKMTVQRCNKYCICTYCKEFILDGEVFQCPSCQTLYHYNGFCNPVPFCYPCKNQLPLFKELYYEWPIELFSKRLKSFLIRPPLPDQVDEQVFELSRSKLQQIRGKYTTVNKLRRDFIFYPSYNSDIRRLGQQDEDLISMYHHDMYYPPILIGNDPQMGKGIFAYRDIKAHEFICFYAGDIINQAYVNAKMSDTYSFEYCRGPSMSTTFVICPHEYWSFGPILNYTKLKKANCQSLKYITDKGIEVIIYATKDIKKGEQLLYDYNAGKKGDYKIQNFKK